MVKEAYISSEEHERLIDRIKKNPNSLCAGLYALYNDSIETAWFLGFKQIGHMHAEGPEYSKESIENLCGFFDNVLCLEENPYNLIGISYGNTGLFREKPEIRRYGLAAIEGYVKILKGLEKFLDAGLGHNLFMFVNPQDRKLEIARIIERETAQERKVIELGLLNGQPMVDDGTNAGWFRDTKNNIKEQFSLVLE